MDIEDIFDTPDTTEQYDVNDIEANKLSSLCAYISILFLVPLIWRKDSSFARFHTNQGIALFVLSVILGALTFALSKVLALIPFVGGIIVLIINLIMLGAVIYLMALGMINAATGKAKELPIIGKTKILK